MCFAEVNLGANLDLSALGESDSTKLLFNENCGIVFQAKNDGIEGVLAENSIEFFKIGTPAEGDTLHIKNGVENFNFKLVVVRDNWFKTSLLWDTKQSGIDKSNERFHDYKKQPLSFNVPCHFEGELPELDEAKPRLKAAILRE